MREIRFRAFDKESGEMHLDANACLVYGESVNEAFDNSHYEWMQFTGLKDKNGVDIYEGDIVAYETHTSVTNGVVQYGNGLYAWVHAGIWFHMWDMHLDSAEVVGNIYENSDLLEVMS